MESYALKVKIELIALGCEIYNADKLILKYPKTICYAESKLSTPSYVALQILMSEQGRTAQNIKD